MVPIVQRFLVVVSCLLVAACSTEREGDTGELTGITQTDGMGSSSGITSTTTTTGPDKLDVGNGSATDGDGDVPTTACKKVDLLFVIDNSGSMADEQANLVAAFPGFINTMRQELASTEGYNVGVVRTDSNDLSCVNGRYGVLVTRNFTANSSNATCTPYASGARYMTQDDDLAAKFSCAALVGTGGDGDEHPAESLMAALTSPNTDPGECNEGFLRDDALLVVVIITDEEDDHETAQDACNMMPSPGSAGDPPDWYQAVVNVKGGIEQNVVVLSLVGPDGADACPPLDKCNDAVDGAEPAPRLVEFTNMFTNGFVGRVCDNYDPFFQEAIATIKSACDEFVPPG
jgi:hypothetical protein